MISLALLPLNIQGEEYVVFKNYEVKIYRVTIFKLLWGLGSGDIVVSSGCRGFFVPPSLHLPSQPFCLQSPLTASGPDPVPVDPSGGIHHHSLLQGVEDLRANSSDEGTHKRRQTKKIPQVHSSQDSPNSI